MSTFRVAKLYEDAILPTRANLDDAGLDLYASDDIIVPPEQVKQVGTGIAIEIPRSYAGLVTPRSGLASKYQISILNTPGVIDSGYRGEVKVLLYNHSAYSYTIAKGDRIGQLVIVPAPLFDIVEVGTLSTTERGDGGFGSSGK